MQTARPRPDGTFEFGEDVYRLEDREPDHFAIRRLRDDKIIGGLRFSGKGCEVEPELGAANGDDHVLRAIGRLLEGTRGILPLQ